MEALEEECSSCSCSFSFSSSSKKKVKVLLLQDELSSEVYAWQEIVQGLEIEFIIVPHPTSSQGWTPIILLQILQEHDYNVDIYCLPQVHWSDVGSYIDLALIGKVCRLHDIKFVIDGTQSVVVSYCAVFGFDKQGLDRLMEALEEQCSSCSFSFSSSSKKKVKVLLLQDEISTTNRHHP